MEECRILEEKNILLVDDDPIIREMLRLAFAGKGCRLQAFASAEEGLAALGDAPFDIVISDLQMPGINGLDFLEHVLESQPKAVTVLISGCADHQAVARAREMGVHAFLDKPFSLESLFTSFQPSHNFVRSPAAGFN